MTIGALLWYVYAKHGITHSENVTHWFAQFWQGDITLHKYVRDFLICYRGYESPEFIVPSSWYLEVDLKMVFVMPVIVILLRKTRWIYAVGILAIGMLGLPIAKAVPPFLIGVMFHHYQGHIVSYLNRRTWLKILSLTVAFVLLDFVHLPCFTIAVDSPYWRFYNLVQSVGAGILILLAVSAKEIKWLSNRLMVYLGGISYEFYILHMVVLLALEPFFVNPYCFVVISLILSLLLSILLKAICQPISAKLSGLIAKI